MAGRLAAQRQGAVQHARLDMAVAHRRPFQPDAPSVQGRLESQVGHDRSHDGLPGELPPRPQEIREDVQERVPVDDPAVRVAGHDPSPSPSSAKPTSARAAATAAATRSGRVAPQSRLMLKPSGSAQIACEAESHAVHQRQDRRRRRAVGAVDHHAGGRWQSLQRAPIQQLGHVASQQVRRHVETARRRLPAAARQARSARAPDVRPRGRRWRPPRQWRA